MRIPNLTMSDAVVDRLNVLRGKQNQLNQQLATGQRVSLPSEDPSAASRIMGMRSEVAISQQYARNIDTATAISEATSSAWASLNQISDRAGEIVAMVRGGVVSAQQRSAYSVEVNQMMMQAIEMGNSQYNGQYLFNGTNITNAPITVDVSGTGVSGVADSSDHPTAVAGPTSGEGLKIQVSDTLQIAPYSSASNNQKIATFINNLKDLRNALESNSSAGIITAQDKLKTSEADIVNAIAETGAGRSRLESIKVAAEKRFSDVNTLINAETDVDIAQAMVDLTKVQTAYQAALTAGGQILKLSLLDYIR